MLHHSPSWFVLSSKVTSDIRYGALLPAAIFTVLAVCTVALRWYTRLLIAAGNAAIEDYFVTAAMVRTESIPNLHICQAERHSYFQYV
jgi:preprotein translocase subunit SecF